MPTSSLCCEGFLGQAKTTSVGLGYPNLALATVPGHVDVQTADELRANVLGTTVDHVIRNLTGEIAAVQATADPDPQDIVFEGSFEEVNRLFLENGWSDGLPIVPPTKEKIAEFLAFTDLPPDHAIGKLLPDNRMATVWNVAVNGVMAGCRPEYMPILVALVEAMADPQYGVEHSGNTPGAETLIVLNGPLIKQLGFNYEQGALRDGFQPNTSIGRFWRLYLRNVAGFLLHQNDKGTFGNTWRVVLAENEDSLAKMKWPTVAVDMGAPAGDSAVTISRFTGGNVIVSVFGDSAEKLLPYLGNALVTHTGWELIFTVGMATGTYRPLLVLSPLIAETIAKTDDQAGRAELAVRECAHAGASVREVSLGLDQPGAGQAHAQRLGAARQDAQGLRRQRSQPAGAGGDQARAHHDRGVGRSAALELLSVRAQRHAGLPDHQDREAAAGLADEAARRAGHERAGMTTTAACGSCCPQASRLRARWIDDTLKQRAAEQGMSAKVPLAADFPRQRIEVVRGPRAEDRLQELFLRRGWSDGLPVVPPTAARVKAGACLHRPLAPTEVLGEVEPLKGLATVEKVAANAVMAGCRPEYLPVVLAAVDCVLDPDFNMRGVQTTDENVTPLLVVNGPVARELDVNGSFGALGPGWQANAAIGRALRLVMNNIGGGWPGAVAFAGLGQPGRYTLCLAENEAQSPWAPLHVEAGMAADTSAVTVTRAETVINVTGGLAEIASVMGSAASGFGILWSGRPTVLIAPAVAADCARRGMSKDDVRRFLWEHGRWRRERLGEIVADRAHRRQPALAGLGRGGGEGAATFRPRARPTTSCWWSRAVTSRSRRTPIVRPGASRRPASRARCACRRTGRRCSRTRRKPRQPLVETLKERGTWQERVSTSP